MTRPLYPRAWPAYLRAVADSRAGWLQWWRTPWAARSVRDCRCSCRSPVAQPAYTDPTDCPCDHSSIAKFGRNDSMIPSNVADAINFYQSRGPLHGRAQIFAANPAQTKILGNLHMTYKDHPIRCDNYPWYARTFNKPHHEIENDQRVWDQAASLIDSEVVSATQKVRESEPGNPLTNTSSAQK